MGEVWRAVDERLDRPVAVKVLRDHIADPEHAARFRREAKIAARLQHPGITVVHDVGSDDGQLFIVMELLHGRDLAAMMAERPDGLPIDTAVSLILQAAEALQAAHADGVVHRDLKPSNLFVVKDSGRLKICDFGIARAVGSTLLTAAGEVFGTPPYMSPEQWRGQQVDGRSDLYSLGCVLYELFTGQRPFAGIQEGALMNQHLHEMPAGPQVIRPEVPSELDRLTLELLAKDPADRPSDASHVIAALQGLCYTPTVRVEPPATASTGSDRSSPGRTGDAAGVVRNGPDRAARLIADAERTALTIRDHSLKAKVLTEIATAVAATRPDRAEHLAWRISGAYWQATMFPVIAQALAVTDPGRAARPIDDAVRLSADFHAANSTSPLLRVSPGSPR